MSKHKNKKTSFKMTYAIRTMIKHADKGPSGFWVDDGEGCGNPDIFPEFDEGLKSREYICISHDICPWNTAVMYGDGHGNIRTGCYHSCSFMDAKHLTSNQIKAVLTRFLERYENGEYKGKEALPPLLTEDEIRFIETAKANAEKEREERWKKEEQERIKKASALLERCPDDWKDSITRFYMTPYIAITGNGIVNFAPESRNEIVGVKDLSYDDYIELQFSSLSTCRHEFEKLYGGGYFARFKGQIEKKTKDRVCFTRIYISGMYHDGECFDAREDHVWMDAKDFEHFETGDCVSFEADVYRYIKTGDGKKLDYGLCNPEFVAKVEPYQLPSDEDLLKQAIDRIICDEMCMFREHCYMGMCIANEDWLNTTRMTLYEACKKEDGGRIDE